MAPFIVTQQVSLLSICSLRCPLRIDELNKTLQHASSQTLETAANLSVRTLICMMSSIRETMPFPHTKKDIVAYLSRLRNTNITDTLVLCSAAMSHSKLSTEQESWDPRKFAF